MFTSAAGILIALIAWFGKRNSEKEREAYDKLASEDEFLRVITLHIREDMKLVALMLGGILLALGVIADRIH